VAPTSSSKVSPPSCTLSLARVIHSSRASATSPGCLDASHPLRPCWIFGQHSQLFQFLPPGIVITGVAYFHILSVRNLLSLVTCLGELGDGSEFTSLTLRLSRRCLLFTLTIMANAHRIATTVLRGIDK